MKIRFTVRPLALAVGSCFAVSPAFGNPTGAQVVSGAVTMQRPDAKTLNVTNSPGAIIHWQGFSIGAGEVTRFIQQSSSSAVLNRVVGADISQINGQLLSNGRVFLINPAGIVIGGGAIVDTAGFVASTLNMLDSDFLAGKLRFQGDASAGSIVNRGWIRTSYGGNVVLVAPNIENHGLVQTPGGDLVLAAGQKLTIGSLEHEGVTFEVQAPTDSVLNVGRLLADGGAVGVFAGTLKHTGDIRANALVRDEGGRVVLKAQTEATLAGTGTISATGRSGGDVQVLGERVRLVDGASIDVSGETRGGTIRIGGDYHGENAAIPNAATTYVGANATLRADATRDGDGGRIIVWSDHDTRMFGSLSARGAGANGAGGFAEVSGRDNLLFAGTADLGAPGGRLGTLLLDPLDLFVGLNLGLISQLVDEATDFPISALTVAPATLQAVTGNVSLFASRYMRITDAINLTTAGQGLTAQVARYPTPTTGPAGTFNNQLDLAASITTNNGAVSLSAPRINVPTGAPAITTNGGAVNLAATIGDISAGSATVNASGATGPGGAVSIDAATRTNIGGIAGASLNAASSDQTVVGGPIVTSGGAVTIAARSAFGFVSTNGITTNGGAVSLSAAQSSVNANGTTNAGGGNVSMSALSGVFAGTIDTTGGVNLNTTAGSISGTVDNAATLNAAAGNGSGFVSVNIGSNTALNANNVTATGLSSTVTLTATGNVNVGTVRAASSPGNTENVTIASNNGSILPMSASSQVTGADVCLNTATTFCGGAPISATGGGIGTAATALNVDVRRSFTMSANGTFNVLLNGAGPNRFTANVGVAPAAGPNYSGTVRRAGGGIDFAASATPTTVTLDTVAFSGFDQRVDGFDPSITFRVPNGALVLPTFTAPQGDTTVPDPLLGIFTAGLPVSISASGDVSVANYARQVTPQSLAKTTSIFSSNGAVTLGSINANKDSVTVTGRTDVSISNSTIRTAGAVSVTATTGNITVGQIDTTSGTGAVTLSAASGTVGALTDTVALEVLSGSTISVTGRNIGTPGFGNPLDLAGSAITLNSPGNGGFIGTAAAPVVANTQVLTVTAANSASNFGGPTGSPFNVSTGPSALRTLTVVANPAGVGNGGTARVRTEVGQPGDTTYQFASDGANFALPPLTPPATQFANGAFSFTSNAGNIALGTVNLPTATFTVNAQNGSIGGGAALDATAITLSAGTGVSGGAVGIVTGNIGAAVRPATLTMSAGNNSSSSARVGAIQTGTISGGAISLTASNGAIATGAIGSAAARAGAVTLTENLISTATGTINTGDITAASVKVTNNANNTTTGNVDVTTSFAVQSNLRVTTGTLDGQTLTITNDGGILTPAPEVTTGAIGTITPPTKIFIFGQDRGSGNAVNIQGPLVAGPAATVEIGPQFGSFPFPRPGATVLGGPMTAGAGSTIDLGHSGAGPFQFTTIDASATGRVTILSTTGIQQTADAASNGITAGTVFLTTNNGAITNTVDPAGRLDLNAVTSLRLDTNGAARFDAHGSTLGAFNAARSQTVAAAPFEIVNLGSGQVITMASAPSDMTLVVQSPTAPLDFTLQHRSGGIALGAGIVTSGGNLSLSANGPIDLSNGGVTTGGAAGGGRVFLETSFGGSGSGGSITTGAIDTTPTGTGVGGPIEARTRFNPGDIIVNGNLTTGPGGGAITLASDNAGSVTRTGAFTISSPTFVDISAANGDIGAAGTPLLITSPRVTLSSVLGTAVRGFTFATLTGTDNLSLNGENGFNVTSDTAFTTLSVATRGTGTGTPGSTLDLTANGQTYTFARPTLDAFNNTIANTFEVANGGGAAPPATATYNAVDGGLLVRGGVTLGSPTLNLGTSGAGDVKLQGTVLSPLVLSNAVQNFRSPGASDLYVTGNVTLSSPSQTVAAGRDLLVTGNATFSSTGTQSLFADRNMTVQAQGGSISITAPTQNISTRVGSMTFTGGALADETIAITGSAAQRISTPPDSGGDLILQGGAGDRSSVSVTYTGPATGTQQLIQVRGNIGVRGGAGSASTALITTGNADQDQIVRAGVRSGQAFGLANGNIDVTGGAGNGSTAGITNTGAGLQQIGESHQICGNSGCTDLDYQSRSITIAGGGDNASAQVVSAGNQHFYTRFGTLTVMGGAGLNATAKVESTSALDQNIGLTPFETGNRMSIVTVQGGAGAGASALITTPAFQRVTMSGAFSLLGGPTGANASATVQGAGQDVRAGSIVMTGGGADNTFARLTSSANQTLTSGPITLAGGGTGAAGSQFTNAGVSIDGQSQTINAGAISISGGAGRDAANVTDTLVRNTSGAQIVNASSITITSGNQFGTAGIRNESTGTTQTITTGGGITLTSTASGLDAALARIENQPATQQKIDALFMDVLTGAGSGTGTSSIVSSAGTQWIHTTNGGMQVAALGAGNANVTAGTTQLLEIDYPGVMQVAGLNGMLDVGRTTRRVASAASAGNSLVQAQDQYVYAGGIFVQGPSNAAATAKLSGTGIQNVSTTVSGLQLRGGAGANSLATVDPTDQTLVVTGPFNLDGGSNNNASSIIAAQGAQQIVATNQPINLTGGSAPGASAIIITSAPSSFLVAANGVNLTAGTAPDADALMLTGNGLTFGGFTVVCNSCATPTLYSSNPQGNGVPDGGAFGSWNSLLPSVLSAAAGSGAGGGGSSLLSGADASAYGSNQLLVSRGSQDENLDSANIDLDLENQRKRFLNRLCN